LLALHEQVTHPAGADTHEHFYEVRARDGEEWHVGFAGDSSRQQSLTCSWRANQQHTLGNTSTELLEFLRLAQELDDLFQFFFGFVDAGYVLERDFLLLHGEQAGTALAER